MTPAEIAGRLLAGDHAGAFGDARDHGVDLNEVARAVSSALCGVSATDEPWSPVPRWRSVEPAALALVEETRSPQPELAEAFLTTVVSSDMHARHHLAAETVRWLVRTIPDAVRAYVVDAMALGSPSGVAYLTSGPFTLPGQEGADWFPVVVRHADELLRGCWVEMRTRPGMPEDADREIWTPEGSDWSAEDWERRLHALADADIAHVPMVLEGIGTGDDIALPPARSSAAQVRCACAHGTRLTEWWVRTIANHLRRYRTGNPVEDVDLVWWAVPDRHLEMLRGILEIAGPEGTRGPLVAAALAAGRVDAQRAAFLSEPLQHPAWAEGEVPWVISEIRDIGEIRVPDGRVVIAELLEPSPKPFVLDTDAAAVTGRLIIATHPLHERPANAALEVTLMPGAKVGSWQYVPVGETGEEGLVCGYGVAGVGAASALESDPSICEDIEGHDAGGRRFALGADGDLFGFSVLIQHAPCRVFVGRGQDGRPVRLIVDLDLIHAAPDIEGRAPWDLGPPCGTPSALRSGLESRASAAGTAAALASDRARRGEAVETDPSAFRSAAASPRGQAHWEAALAHSAASLHHRRLAIAAERAHERRAMQHARRAERRHRLLAEEHRRASRQHNTRASGWEAPAADRSPLA